MKTTKGDTYMTLGPYEERKAKNMVHGYLSTGICSWVDWQQDDDKILRRTTKQGILTNIICKYLGEREVTFACVLPMKSDQIIELNITQIRKM